MRAAIDRGCDNVRERLGRDVPRALAQAVAKAMSPVRAARFASAAQMRARLEEFAVEEGIHLSSMDLADLVETYMATVERQTSPSNPLDSVPAANTGLQRPKAAVPSRPFDALLGRELVGVESTEPFSVFTSTQRPSGVSVDAGEASQPSARGRQRRAWMTWVALAAFAVGAVALVPRWGGLYVNAAEANGTTQRSEPLSTVAQAPGSVAAGSAKEEVVPVRDELASDVKHSATDAAVAMRPLPRSRPRRASSESPTRAARRSARAVASVGPTATVSVNTLPWSQVYIDGRLVSATPVLGHSLRAGPHIIEVRNPSLGHTKQLPVVLEPGAHRRISLDLRAEQSSL